MTRTPDAFVVLAGGRGARLGGVDKAAIVVGGAAVLDRVLAVVPRPVPVVVVGPEHPTARPIRFTREEPAGGGPAAAVAAGIAVLRQEPALSSGALVGIWAVDHVGVAAEAWSVLADAAGAAGVGACLRTAGRLQYGVSVVPLEALTAAVASRPTWHNASLRALLDPLLVEFVDARADEARDIDTLEDLHWWQTHAGDTRPRTDRGSDERNPR